ncbi:unnamed protein product [Absidia cylindrospora]
MITAAWFNQKDFTQLDILYNLYNNLTNTFCGPIDDSTLYMGTSLRELLHKFKSKTLILLKLLLLEKRILFYGYPVERLCTFEYSLISLIPGLLRSLQDSGAPELDISDNDLRQTEAKELENGNKGSLLRYMGLPLRIFEKGSFFQPYLPLQQIDMLKSNTTKSYVVGTTNSIFFHHKSDIDIDVLVNVETGTFEFYDQKLQSIVNLTLADRRWMENIVKVVYDTWDTNDPSRPMQNTYLGSDDYLRARFEEYVLSLLSSTKHAQDTNVLSSIQGSSSQDTNVLSSIQGSSSTSPMAEDQITSDDIMLDDDKERNYVMDYGIKWWLAWRDTTNFKLWNHYTDHEIYEIVEPGHPGMGHISILDIQNTLTNRFRDLQLRNNLGPFGKTLSKAMSGGAKAVSNGGVRLLRGVDALWNEFEKGPHNEHDHDSSSNTSAGSGKVDATHPSIPDRLPPNSTSTSRSNHDNESMESTSQQASRLFSNFSTFISRKQKEFSSAIEESIQSPSPSLNRAPNPPSSSSSLSSSAEQQQRQQPPQQQPLRQGSMSPPSVMLSDDDSSSTFVDVGAMYNRPSKGNELDHTMHKD